MKYPNVHRCLIAFFGLLTSCVAVLGAATAPVYAGEFRIATMVCNGTSTTTGGNFDTPRSDTWASYPDPRSGGFYLTNMSATAQFGYKDGATVSDTATSSGSVTYTVKWFPQDPNNPTSDPAPQHTILFVHESGFANATGSMSGSSRGSGIIHATVHVDGGIDVPSQPLYASTSSNRVIRLDVSGGEASRTVSLSSSVSGASADGGIAIGNVSASVGFSASLDTRSVTIWSEYDTSYRRGMGADGHDQGAYQDPNLPAADGSMRADSVLEKDASPFNSGFYHAQLSGNWSNPTLSWHSTVGGNPTPSNQVFVVQYDANAMTSTDTVTLTVTDGSDGATADAPPYTVDFHTLAEIVDHHTDDRRPRYNTTSSLTSDGETQQDWLYPEDWSYFARYQGGSTATVTTNATETMNASLTFGGTTTAGGTLEGFTLSLAKKLDFTAGGTISFSLISTDSYPVPAGTIATAYLGKSYAIEKPVASVWNYHGYQVDGEAQMIRGGVPGHPLIASFSVGYLLTGRDLGN